MSWLTGIYGYLGVGLLAALLSGSGIYWVTSRGYQTTIAEMRVTEAQTQTTSIQLSLEHLQKFISTMDSANTDYQASTQLLLTRLDGLQKEFHNATKASPLPADCRPDAERLRLLTSAVAAANDSSPGVESGTTVRTAPSP